VAIPKGRGFDGIDPFQLADPWRTFVWQAKKSQRQFAESVRSTREGPLKERLREIADRIETGVHECWQVAQSGHALTEARSRIDIATLTRDLSQLPTGTSLQANPALAQTAEALQAQLDTAKRMDEIIADTRDRLRLLDARLGELVTRVLELSVRPQGLDDLAAIGADVDSVVGEMEALRQALDETDRTSDARSATPPPALPPPTAERLLGTPTPTVQPAPTAQSAPTAQPQPAPAPPPLADPGPTTQPPAPGRA
jgi:hypothetical protein